MKIYLVGVGMGNNTLTVEAQNIIKKADIMIGADRLLKNINTACEKFCSYKPDEIVDFLKNKEVKTVCILLSGDVGFYSGAKRLLRALADYDVELVAGISSVAYFCAKLKKDWQNTKLLSLHGKKANIILYIKKYSSVFTLLSGNEDIKRLCEKLCLYGMGNTLLHIGENLSYDDEKIISIKACDLKEFNFKSLVVLLAENPDAKDSSLGYIDDEEFIRGNVPMTKSEIRTLSISKLCLQENSVLYDIGAGTGSVSVEAGLRLTDGQVYAIEKNETALELIEKNKIKFGADNVNIIKATAPHISEEMLIPTHVFIGGSNGNLSEIIKWAFHKNKDVKIVINAIALNTVAEIVDIIKNQNLKADITCVNVAKNKVVGDYQLMTGLNPVYIVSIN